MGKIVLSSEDEMEERIQETEVKQAGNRHKKKNKGDGGGGGGGGGGALAAAGTSSSSVVEWARFLPKMVLRVLLVEADDSTRQIIAALLRKCSYRVAAVSDGLKAWEVLKGSPENIDLILTEVELPSISGYALLTLIMEHDACKNIPVIMMSSQDSISTVYKCMLRGAADFLVKPVRKNELKNLWQHVWRKQASSSAGNEAPDDSVAQQKVEATAENKANSNHSSGFIACVQRNRECIDKGSDAQSSCTKPEVDAEKTDIEHGHYHPQMINLQFSDDLNTPKHEECHGQSLKTQRHNNEGGDKVITGMEQANVNVQKFENNNFSREAIDLIGAFDNYGKGIFGSSASNVTANKYDSLSHLDLSLRRVNPSGPVNQVNEEHRLNHSDASAFYRYVGKQLHPAPHTCDQQKDLQHESDNALSNHVPQKNENSLPIHMKGIRFENVIRACDFAVPTSNHSESFRRMNQLNPSESPSSSSQQINDFKDQKIDVIDQTDTKLAQKLEIMGDMEDLCPENDQSANSSFCVGYTSHHPVNEGSAVKTTSEHVNDEGFNVYEGSSHRTLQREEALKKFRLKRKERCFEKKVRYESRKKLAEQRPRVKGQFVRQMPTDDLQRGDSSTG
ncbi:LOW QUALITY PROTEIN: two-component response regulator-like APRR5 [Primulina eburnea]|uniref:LOW QUALITY PROTEIN: two-component response regulator-like APRR5 n=1 Tax=Primulina eburnea TaxID=1245227 RepID=UPI003C6BE160